MAGQHQAFRASTIARRTRVALTCGMLLIGASAAHADTITASEFFLLPLAAGGGNPTQSHVASISQLNPAIGTLDSIEIELVRGVLNFSWTIDHESPFTSLVTDNKSSVRTRLAWLGGEIAEFAQTTTLPPVNQFVSFDTDAAPDFVGADALTFTGSVALLNETLFPLDPTLFTAFIGTGTILLEESARFLPGGSPGPGIFHHDATLAQSVGGIIVRYQFTPVPRVPEPGTLLLGISGLSALLVRRRAQRPSRH